MWLKKKTPQRRRKDGEERNVKEMRPDSGPHSLLQPSGLGTAERDRCSSAELGKSRTGGTEK